MQTVTINKQQFNLPAPYAEGHQVTAGEASALNQLLVENVRNNITGKMKKIEEENEKRKAAGQPELPQIGQAEIDAYVAEYKFGVRTGGSTVRDPIEAEARRIAQSLVNDALKKNGKKIKDVSDEQMEQLITGALEKNPVIRERAKAIVEARSSALDGISLG